MSKTDGTAARAGAGSTGADRQMEIYLGGLSGQRLSIPVSVTKLEQRAAEMLSAEAYDYVAGGAGAERTMSANIAAFDRWKIVPRMLCDVSTRSLATELLGQKINAPVLLAPVGVQGIVHPDAEVASSRAAASVGIPFVLSTLSSKSIEEVANAMGGVRWFQLYWGKDEDVNASMLARAEAAGYRAVVVTLDTQILGWRDRDLERSYLPFLQAKGLANYFTDPAFRGKLAATPEEDPAAAVKLWASIFGYTKLNWSDLVWLRKTTRLPVVLKGVQHPDDAKRAIDAGIDAIMVSNHGGRQIDGAIGSLDALPAVIEAVHGAVPVVFDSGIRRGSDAVKALALGAKAVALGRLYIWGLAVAGEAGVRDTVSNFIAELDLTMALSGYRSCRELSSSLLVREP